MQGYKQAHMNLRISGCKDESIQANTYEAEDMRMQGCKQAHKLEDMRMQRCKKGHMNMKI